MAQARIAIAGATGNVGRELVRVLEEKNIVKDCPIFLASGNGAGDIIPFKETSDEVKLLSDFDFKDIDLIFFATPKEVSEMYVEKALEAGVRVIDMSDYSASNMEVPLVSPDVNLETLPKTAKHVAMPYSISVALSSVLNALQKKASIKHVTTTAMVATSANGRYGMDELFGQSANLLGGAGAEQMDPMEFKQQIAFNVIPQVGAFAEGASSTDVEMSAIIETNRIMGAQLPITCTAVYVPTFIGASQSLTIEFNSAVSAEEARKVLEEAEDIMLIDNVKNGEYSTPFGAAETDYVYTSRIRQDAINPNILSLWVVCDNLRKGCALGAFQVAEKLVG